MNKNETIKYNILNKIKVDINITKNKFDIPIDELLHMAARVNPKRSFLFVSKVLGKHIPIKPQRGLVTGALLGAMYHEGINNCEGEFSNDLISIFKGEDIDGEGLYSQVFDRVGLKEETLFVGFAETATALGHSAFSFFNENGYYIHTTREDIQGFEKCITFEEEHSHATSHRVYAQNEDIIKSESPVVLIDDEITTGNTLLNIIEAMHKRYPRKHYSVLTILDWRNGESQDAFKKLENKLGITIDVYSIVKGWIDVDDHLLKENPLVNEFTVRANEYSCDIKKIDVSNIFACEAMDDIGYLNCTGRVGLDTDANDELLDLLMITGNYIDSIVENEKVLCIGTEEFMFIPMAVSALINKDVSYQSTTRSPIYPCEEAGYGAMTADKISSVYSKDVQNYIYNIDEEQYDEAIVFVERDENIEDSSMIKQLVKLGFKEIKIVHFI